MPYNGRINKIIFCKLLQTAILFVTCHDDTQLMRYAPFPEPNAREFEAVRLDLQQQVVRRHLHHPLPQQEGSLRGEDFALTAHHLFPGILRCSGQFRQMITDI